MAKFSCELSNGTDKALEKVSVLLNIPKDDLINKYAIEALNKQLEQFIDDACKAKLKNMTYDEKLAFLG